MIQNQKTNSLATGALVIGIIGLFINLAGIVPLFAILFGISAIMFINDKGGRGKGIAYIAILLGIAGIVLTVLRFMLCYMMIDNFSL